MRLKYPINLHKGMTALVVVCLMIWYDHFSTGAWIYLALHGSYGFLWLFKSRTYPDPKWEERVSVPYSVLVFLALGLYWIPPYILISQHKMQPDYILAASVALNMFGMVLHFGSDAQKYFTLKYKPGLITEGFFARCRHTNYLGELMIYSGFALLCMSWVGFLGIGLFFGFVFIPGMMRKEKSLSRYAEWEDYKSRTGFLWPRL